MIVQEARNGRWWIFFMGRNFVSGLLCTLKPRPINLKNIIIVIIIITLRAPAGASPFPRFHAGRKLCAGPTMHSPMFWCLRSFSTVRSHVWRGRPRGHLHSFGGTLMPALRARVWSSSGSERMMWPKNLRRLSMTVWLTARRRTITLCVKKRAKFETV